MKLLYVSKFVTASLFFVCMIFSQVFGQQNVSISDVNGATPNASSVLDISSSSKGLLIPRVSLTSTTVTSPVTLPLTSLLVYNTSTVNDVTPGYYYWNGTSWQRFDTGNTIGDWKLLGNAGTNAGTNFLGTTDAADLVFRTNSTEKMRVMSGGKVGIGTSAPNNPLHVIAQSSTDFDVLRLDGSHTSGSGLLLSSTATGGRSWDLISTATAATEGAGKLLFKDMTGGSGVRMTIEGSTGNVGIGTTSPNASSLLEVNSTSKGILIPQVSLTATNSAGPITSPAASLLVYNSLPAGSSPNNVVAGFYYNSGSAASPIWKRFSTGNGDAWITNGNTSLSSPATPTTYGTTTIGSTENWIGTTDAVDFVVGTNQVERLRVKQSTGKIGIGTAAPAMRLDVTDASTTANDATIRGAATGAAGTYGVLGTSSSATGQGVFGFNFNSSGTGVIGAGNNLTAQYLAGGSGGAFTSSNVGVYGYGNNTAASYGVLGQSVNASGIGVLGQASSSSGFNVGVYGISSSPAGDGINAINNVAAGTGDGNGIYGTTAQTIGFGVWGTNSNSIGTGVVGSGNGVTSQYLTNGSGGAFTGSTTGVYANNSSLGISQAIYSNNGGTIGRVNYWSGATQYKILGTGTVSTVANGLSGNKVVLHAPETPEIYFQDYGNAQLINGKAHVDLDPIFAKNITVNENHPLQVFIQLNGDCKGVFVTNRQSDGFDVIELQSGNSNVEFTWSVTANRADELLSNGRISKYTDIRFEKAPDPIDDDIKQLKLETTRDKLTIINSTLISEKHK